MIFMHKKREYLQILSFFTEFYVFNSEQLYHQAQKFSAQQINYSKLAARDFFSESLRYFIIDSAKISAVVGGV